MTELIELGKAIGAMVIGGGLVHFFKSRTENVESHEKALPVISQSLTMIERATNEIKKSIDELYNARNQHNDRLIRIEVTHQMRGCSVVKGPNGEDVV